MSALLATALVLSLAQQELPRSELSRITAPVREVAMRVDHPTGRAQRISPGFVAGTAQSVFDNTCPRGPYGGYYIRTRSTATTGGSQSEAIVDQGRIPSTASAQNAQCTPGSADAYRINQLEIAYCTTTGGSVTYVTHLLDRWGAPCPNIMYPVMRPTVLDVTVTGLPRSPSQGVLACYVVTLDLGTPGFVLHGGAANTSGQRFAWTAQYPGTTGEDGPHWAGNPWFGGCAPCVGTIWERPQPTTNPGTGLGSTDSFWRESFGGTSTGCFFCGRICYSSFYLELFAVDPTVEPELGAGFCDGNDGAHASCPCGASDPAAGCDHSGGNGVRLAIPFREFGPDTAELVGTGFPPATSPAAVLIRGTALEPFPIVFGDGLRCVAPANFARVGATVATAGATDQLITHGAGPGTFHYQLWYRNFPVSYCVTTGPSSGAFNLSNGRSLAW